MLITLVFSIIVYLNTGVGNIVTAMTCLLNIFTKTNYLTDADVPDGVRFERTRHHGEVWHERWSHRASSAGTVATTSAALPRSSAGLGRTVQ